MPPRCAPAAIHLRVEAWPRRPTANSGRRQRGLPRLPPGYPASTPHRSACIGLNRPSELRFELPDGGGNDGRRSFSRMTSNLRSSTLSRVGSNRCDRPSAEIPVAGCETRARPLRLNQGMKRNARRPFLMIEQVRCADTSPARRQIRACSPNWLPRCFHSRGGTMRPASNPTTHAQKANSAAPAQLERRPRAPQSGTSSPQR